LGEGREWALNMKIHEYQAKETLKKFNVSVQDGIPIKV